MGGPGWGSGGVARRATAVTESCFDLLGASSMACATSTWKDGGDMADWLAIQINRCRRNICINTHQSTVQLPFSVS